MVEKRTIDWDAVERDYRAGAKPLKLIGAEHGVSDAGIIKRAKRDGWVRDLGAKIRAKAEAKVSADAVSKVGSTLTKATEKEIVEANAEVQVRIRREHRGDIQRMRTLIVRFIAELEKDDEEVDPKKKLALQVRVSIMQKIADTHKTVVAMEREHFGITAQHGDDEGQAMVAMEPVELARKIAFLFATAIHKGA